MDRDRSPLTEKDSKPYAGCYVNAKLQLWTQDNQHGKGIRCEHWASSLPRTAMRSPVAVPRQRMPTSLKT